MIKELTLKEALGSQYIMLYDSEYMTDQQAKTELMCKDIGGYDPNLSPYFIIYPICKEHIVKTITKEAQKAIILKN